MAGNVASAISDPTAAIGSAMRGATQLGGIAAKGVMSGRNPFSTATIPGSAVRPITPSPRPSTPVVKTSADTQQNPPSISDTIKSQMAMDSLRDLVYQQQPHKFFGTDISEDIPSLRPYGSHLANILPSAAIISRDPNTRKTQLDNAEKEFKRTQHKDHPFLKDLLTKSTAYGLGSMPFSAAFTVGELGLRGKLKGFRTNPEVRKNLAKHLEENIVRGSAAGATFGTAPLIASKVMPIKDKDLTNAKQVLQDHPTLSSMPFADTVLLHNQARKKKDKLNHLENAGLGAGLGATAAGAGQASSAGYRGLDNAVHHAKKTIAEKMMKSDKAHSFPQGVKDFFESASKAQPPHTRSEILDPIKWKGLRGPLAVGAGAGLALGGLSSHFLHKKDKQRSE